MHFEDEDMQIDVPARMCFRRDAASPQQHQLKWLIRREAEIAEFESYENGLKRPSPETGLDSPSPKRGRFYLQHDVITKELDFSTPIEGKVSFFSAILSDRMTPRQDSCKRRSSFHFELMNAEDFRKMRRHC